jgi:GTPase SAR1 family protein
METVTFANETATVPNNVFVLGAWGAGKTMYVNSLTGGEWRDEYIGTEPDRATIRRLTVPIHGGVLDFNVCDVPAFIGNKVSLEELCGQAYAYLVMFDISNKPTFKDAGGFLDAKNWIHMAKGVNPHAKILLLGNKSDLQDEREVSGEEAENLAKETGAVYIEMSVKDKSNIYLPFKKMMDLEEQREEDNLNKRAKIEKEESEYKESDSEYKESDSEESDSEESDSKESDSEESESKESNSKESDSDESDSDESDSEESDSEEESSEDSDGEDLYSRDGLMKLTIKRLKEVAKEEGINVKSLKTKSDITDRILFESSDDDY